MNVRWVRNGSSALELRDADDDRFDSKAIRIFLSHDLLLILSVDDGRVVVRTRRRTHYLYFDPLAFASHAVAQIAVGETHMLFTTRGARLFGVGCNSHSQLAQPSSSSLAFTRQPIELLLPALTSPSIDSVGVGDGHSVVIACGRAFVCGANLDGQCGVGRCSRSVDKLTELVVAGSSFASVTCGPNFSVFVLRCRDDAASARVTPTLTMTHRQYLMACGFNMHGELASGQFEPSSSLQRMLFVRRDDDDDENASSALLNINKVACGRQHVVCIDENGEAYASGSVEFAGIDGVTRSNRFMLVEQLAAARVVDVACGATQTIFDDQHRRCFVVDGRAGADGNANDTAPPSAEFRSIALREHESVVAIGAHFKTTLVALARTHT